MFSLIKTVSFYDITLALDSLNINAQCAKKSVQRPAANVRAESVAYWLNTYSVLIICIPFMSGLTLNESLRSSTVKSKM